MGLDTSAGWIDRETEGQVDRHGDQRCQKTARDGRMEKIGIRPENVGKKN